MTWEGKWKGKWSIIFSHGNRVSEAAINAIKLLPVKEELYMEPAAEDLEML